MTLDDYNNVLSLMAAIIFADKQVFESEISTFVQSVSQLDFDHDFIQGTSNTLTISPDLAIEPEKSTANDCDLNGLLLPSKLSNWYEHNKDQIHKNLSTPFYKDWFYGLLDQLTDLPNKEKIITIMNEISRADGNVHINERSLITLAERHWGMR